MPPEAMHSRFTSAGESPGFLLWRISNAWQQRQRAALLPLGLTHVQFVLLASLVWLTQHGRTVTQTDLAEQAQTDPMMTSQVVRGQPVHRAARGGEALGHGNFGRLVSGELSDGGERLHGLSALALLPG